MMRDQLLSELAEIKDPLFNRNTAAVERVLNLYPIITGKPARGTGCFPCALDAFYELQRIAQIGEGWDNSVNLPDQLKNKSKQTIYIMKKYMMTRPSFREFGSPDTITEQNTTDEQVEAMLKRNPDLSKFFVLRDSAKAEAEAAVKVEMVAIATEKKKGGRKAVAKLELTPIELEDVPVPEGQAFHEEEVTPTEEV